MKINFFQIVLVLLFNLTFAQNIEDQSTKQITQSEYYNLTRENIHLHLNKSIYLTNETIWFKGYIINKIENLLNLETTNIYVSLLNSKKEPILTKLFLGTNGITIGQLKLNENLESGDYFIHTYTNYMNNFSEDESTYIPIEIINLKEKISSSTVNKFENIKIDFSLEGGKIIAGTTSKIGIYLKNCFGEGIECNTVRIVDNNGNSILVTSTNEFGYGVFKMKFDNNLIYKIIVTIDNKVFEQALPIALQEGINLNVENNLFEKDALNLEIITNSKSLSNLKNNEHKLIIQKNEQFGIVNLKIDKELTSFVLNKSKLFNGINFLRLVDAKNNLVSERIIYNHTNNPSNIVLEKQLINNDSLKIKGKLNQKIANLSISILPKGTLSKFENNSIISQFLINNQIQKSLVNLSLHQYSKKTEKEIDMMLIFEKNPKYNWSNFLNKKPIEKFEFEKGLNLNITLNQNLPNKNQFYGNLISKTSNQFFKEKMGELNTFNFKNLIIKDSSDLIFSIEKGKSLFKEKINTYTTITNNKKRFFRTYYNLNTDSICSNKIVTKLTEENNEYIIGNKDKVIKEILITKKLEKLEHQNEIGNKQARTLKIDPNKNNKTIFQIIRENGYHVERVGIDYKVYNYQRDARGSKTSPTILLNDNYVNDLMMIDDSTLDEIYFNKFDMINARNNDVGTIKIFTKPNYNLSNDGENGTKVIKILNGFQNELPYENKLNSGFQLPAFKKYASIHWIPNINTDLNGNFEFKLPKFEQEEFILNIQGIDNDGNYYFETFNINVN